MSKQIEFDSNARVKLKAGVDALANAVKTTLGPKGRNVVIGKNSVRHMLLKMEFRLLKKSN